MFPVMKAPSTVWRVMYLNSLEEKDFLFINVQIPALLFFILMRVIFFSKCQVIAHNFQVTKVNFSFFFWVKNENLRCHMFPFSPDFEPLLIATNVSQMSVSENLCSCVHSHYKRSNYLIKHSHFCMISCQTIPPSLPLFSIRL